MAEELRNIHSLFLEKIQKRYGLRPVRMKNPMPERPARGLGLIKMDGNLFESDKFMRVMVLTSGIAFTSRCTRSIFLGPRPELYLPIFSSETILMGEKRAFLVDIHPTVRPARWGELALEPRMLAIRSRYAELVAEPVPLEGKINDIMSPAYIYVHVPPDRDAMALSFFNEYLDLYLEMVDRAVPVAGADRQKSGEDFERYHDTVINHDPAVKLYGKLFGEQGAIERVNDIFFAR